MSIADYPTEVLLKIFHYAVGDGPLELDSPALWDDVRFPYGAYRRNTLLLEELLARSGTRPLTAVFSHPQPGWAGRMVDFWPLFKKMKEYCSRFRTLYAILPTPGIYDPITPPVAVDFENAPALAVFHLERISYSSDFRNTSASMRFIHLRFVDIPVPVVHGFHDLTIMRSPLPFFNRADPLPHIALTSLTLDGITSLGYPDELLEFLLSCHMPQLRDIELANLDQKFRFSSQFARALAPPAVYPAMHSAKFTALTLANVTPEFFHALPALETLVLVDVNPEPLLSLPRDDCALCPALREIPNLSVTLHRDHLLSRMFLPQDLPPSSYAAPPGPPPSSYAPPPGPPPSSDPSLPVYAPAAGQSHEESESNATLGDFETADLFCKRHPEVSATIFPPDHKDFGVDKWGLVQRKDPLTAAITDPGMTSICIEFNKPSTWSRGQTTDHNLPIIAGHYNTTNERGVELGKSNYAES
ncbi:hypothetical protein B0H13DRAFT_2356295 [Mycena leptocephala]|nr:hypothetical protein B0H13DRAFT_2356295 [Mycena leptocephala]